MTTTAWPFLITCNKDIDYGTVVAPDFVCEAGAGYVFGRFAGGEQTPEGHAYHREARDERAGTMSLVYRVVEATSAQLGEGGDKTLIDDWGRPVLLIEGFVVRPPHPELALTAADLDRAHEAVAGTFKEFWGRKTWEPRPSAPLSLEMSRDAPGALTLLGRAPVGSRPKPAARSDWEAHFLDPASHAGSAVDSLVFSPDGDVLASRRLGRPLILWDVKTGGVVGDLLLEPFTAGPHCPLAFSPSSSSRLFIGLNSPAAGRESPYAIVRWDGGERSNADPVQVIKWVPAPIRLLTLTAGGKSIVVIGEDDYAYDLVRDSFINSLLNPGEAAYDSEGVTRLRYRAEAMGVSSNERYRATGDDQGVVRLYRAGFAELIFSERAHASQVTVVTFSPGSNYFVTAGRDREIVLWDAKNRSAVGRLNEHRQAVKSVLFSDDRETMVTADVGGEIKVWDSKKKMTLKDSLKAEGVSLTALALSPDGRTIAAATDRNRIQLWRRRSPRRHWRDDE